MLLSKNTAVNINTIPMNVARLNLSPSNITLNNVAAIGSTIPKAAAVPTGKVLSESVYKKYGITQVHNPQRIIFTTA